ncbi:aldo/keto reductase [Candidatus Lokiarchaeum ossiferum]|uniref:aldo/keto reductase n=1 Tax=Candidatus Lokiarchaeum ossiferum TaxID=2951803 RepID=UPI00352D0642
MKKIRLGRTDLEISRIGMGGIPLQRPSEENAVKLIKYALDQGINLIDTSRHYGTSEERIGKALKGRRDEVVLITRQSLMDGMTAKKNLQQSLATLQTDYIDVWEFHNVGKEKYENLLKPGSAFDIAKQAQKEGKIKHIGITSHCFETMEKAIISENFDVVLFPFNFVNNEAADSLIPLAKKLDIGFTSMKPFAGGRLQNASLVMKYLMQFDDVIPVPGFEKIEEIEEVVKIVEGNYKLSTEEMHQINLVKKDLGKKFCQWCGYCMPSCPQDIYIPGVINLKVSYNLWPQGDFVANYQEEVNKAKKCIECRICESKCPYSLETVNLLKKGIDFFDKVAQL